MPILLWATSVGRLGLLSVRSLGLLVVGVAAALVFVRVELRTVDPVVDVRMLARRRVRALNLPAVCDSVGGLGATIIVPQLIVLPAATGWGMGGTESQAGYLLLLTSIGILVGAPSPRGSRTASIHSGCSVLVSSCSSSATP